MTPFDPWLERWSLTVDGTRATDRHSRSGSAL